MASRLPNRKPGGVAAALGFAVHTGWTYAVVVTLQDDAPVVLRKERLALWDPGQRGAAHFYHRAAELGPAQAQAIIARDEATARRVTAAGLRRIAESLAERGYRLAAARVADKPRRPLPPLEKILTAHPLIHAAEGALFRAITLAEAAKLTRDAREVDSAELAAAVAKAAGLTTRTVTAQVDRAGKASGSPWTQEHRACALAGWHALLTSGTAPRRRE